MFFKSFEYFLYNSHIPRLIVSLFDKIHLFLPCVTVEHIVDLLKRDQAILLRSDKDTWYRDILKSILKVNIIYVKTCLLGYYRLDVVVYDIK